MLESLEEQALREGVLLRAWRDTKTCLQHWAFWAAESIGAAIVGIKMGPEYSLIFIVSLFLAVFIVNIALAPKQQRDEVRAIILRNQRELDVDIGIPLISLVGTEKVSTLKHLGEGVW
jgi:hypothetical protein